MQRAKKGCAQLLDLSTCGFKNKELFCPLVANRSYSIKKLFTNKPSTPKRAPIVKGTVSGSLHVPPHILRPEYAESGEPVDYETVEIKTEEEIEKMRASCRLAAQTLKYAGSLVKAGVTTDYIDRLTHEFIIGHNAYPSPLNYRNFPKSICTSINEVMCHGIPDSRELQPGDMLNIDITVYLNGFHGDTSAMFFVKAEDDTSDVVPENIRKLCECSEMSMYAAISACGPGKRFSVVGNTIGAYAKKAGYTIPYDLIGHGIGRYFHTPPHIFFYPNTYGEEEVGASHMQPGMTFTIEPVINEKGCDYRTWNDGWTIVSRDKGLSAQYEHTILITSTGVEVLTAQEGQQRYYNNNTQDVETDGSR